MRRGGLLVFFLVLLLAGSEAGSAWAAEGEDGVNIFKLELGLGFWTVIVFLVLLWVLKRYAWGPMLEGLQKREQNIQGAIEDAKRAREEAERLRDQLQAEMNQAHEKVRDILDEGRRHARQLQEEMLGKARAQIEADRERSRREIELARDQALQELWNRTAQLAALVSAKAIRRHITPDDHRRLVDDALAELDQAGSERQRQVASVRT